MEGYVSVKLVSYLGDLGTPAGPVWSFDEEVRAGIPGRPWQWGQAQSCSICVC